MSKPIYAVATVALLLALCACQDQPLTPQEAADQHRFETGCRWQDAQGYELNMPYCGHNGGGNGGNSRSH